MGKIVVTEFISVDGTLWAQSPGKTMWTLTEATVYGDSTLVTIYRRR